MFKRIEWVMLIVLFGLLGCSKSSTAPKAVSEEDQRRFQEEQKKVNEEEKKQQQQNGKK